MTGIAWTFMIVVWGLILSFATLALNKIIKAGK
jgi:hypothetical protein